MLVVLIVAIVAAIGTLVFRDSRGRANTTSAARLTKTFIHRARMQAIYRGVNHFVVLDQDSNLLSIFADTGSSVGEFDGADELVASTTLTRGVDLSLPGVPTLPSPFGSGTVGAAWSLPAPSGGAWTASQRGILVNPRGAFQSAESAPSTITSGTIVFSTPGPYTSAVTLRGTLGAVRSYEYREGQWSEM